MKPNAIVTIPPYADFIDEVVRHPIVSGIRLNTVMPTKDNLEELLTKLNDLALVRGKELWLDLKGRQLRVEGYWVPPYTEIKVSHNLQVTTPTKVLFNDGKEEYTLLEVDKNRLFLQEGPRRVVGPGESINIPDDSLEIEGYLTDTDKKYIAAAEKVGIKNYMLSFVESVDDVLQFKNQVLDAKVVAKIESRKGLEYVDKGYAKECALMAARGDLYVEVKRPHLIINALENILRKDENAIVASRIFSNLANDPEPTCEDIGDVDNLLRMGYKTFMFGDDICLRRESILNGLNLFYAMSEKYV